jgi:hypothetical protein
MNLITEIGFAIDDTHGTQQKTEFHDALIGNHHTTDLLIYIGGEISKFIDILYPNVFPSTVHYYWNDYNNV